MRLLLAALVLAAFGGSVFAGQKITHVHQPKQHVRVINPIRHRPHGHNTYN